MTKLLTRAYENPHNWNPYGIMIKEHYKSAIMRTNKEILDIYTLSILPAINTMARATLKYRELAKIAQRENDSARKGLLKNEANRLDVLIKAISIRAETIASDTKHLTEARDVKKIANVVTISSTEYAKECNNVVTEGQHLTDVLRLVAASALDQKTKHILGRLKKVSDSLEEESENWKMPDELRESQIAIVKEHYQRLITANTEEAVGNIPALRLYLFIAEAEEVLEDVLEIIMRPENNCIKLEDMRRTEMISFLTKRFDKHRINLHTEIERARNPSHELVVLLTREAIISWAQTIVEDRAKHYLLDEGDWQHVLKLAEQYENENPATNIPNRPRARRNELRALINKVAQYVSDTRFDLGPINYNERHVIYSTCKKWLDSLVGNNNHLLRHEITIVQAAADLIKLIRDATSGTEKLEHSTRRELDIVRCRQWDNVVSEIEHDTRSFDTRPYPDVLGKFKLDIRELPRIDFIYTRQAQTEEETNNLRNYLEKMEELKPVGDALINYKRLVEAFNTPHIGMQHRIFVHVHRIYSASKMWKRMLDEVRTCINN